MQTAEIYEKLTELFRELFADDLIVLTPQTTANDIEGWDSFNHISVIVAVSVAGMGLLSRTIRLRTTGLRCEPAHRGTPQTGHAAADPTRAISPMEGS